MIFLKRRALMTRASFNYKTVSGIGSAVLENCVGTKFKRLMLSGNSVQTSTKGINLIPFKVGEKIKSSNKGNSAVFGKDGVNVTVNNINPIKESDLYFFGNDNISVEGGYSDTLLAGDYTFLSNSKLCNFYVVVWRNGTTEIIVERSDKLITHFTVLDGDKVRLFLRPKGNARGTEKAQVMLCKHTETNLPYEPYAGGKPSPSPEYPQEVISAGRKSRNLFDITKLKSKMISAENINIEESTITLPVGGAVYFNKLKDVCTDLKVGDEVYLFAKTTGTREFAGFYHETISIPNWNFNMKQTVTESMLDSALLLYSDGDKSVVVSDIMITKVNDNTYEPYSDKFFVDVEVTGKNLFDINTINIEHDDEKIVVKQGDTYGITLVRNFKENTVYTVSFESYKNYGSSSHVLFEFVYTDGSASEHCTNNFPSKGFSSNANKTIKYLWIRNPWKAYGEITKIQVEKGIKRTEYEAYKEPQTVQLQLDEPLQRIGNHRDVITKDGIVRKIKEIVLDGSEQWIEVTPSYFEKNKRYGLVLEDVIYSTVNKKFAMCNIFPFGNINNDEIAHSVYSNRIYFVCNKDTFPNLQTWREWLSKNPATVQYVLRTSLFEQFPQETQLALDSIHANDETTIISVDSGEVETGIEVEYAVKS